MELQSSGRCVEERLPKDRVADYFDSALQRSSGYRETTEYVRCIACQRFQETLLTFAETPLVECQLVLCLVGF